MLRAFPTAVIENLRPLVDGGRYPIKRVVGEDLAVRGGYFQGRPRRRRSGAEVARRRCERLARNAMTHVDNDRWRGDLFADRKRNLRIHRRGLDRYIPRLAPRVRDEVQGQTSRILQSEALGGREAARGSGAARNQRRRYARLRSLRKKFGPARTPRSIASPNRVSSRC